MVSRPIDPPIEQCGSTLRTVARPQDFTQNTCQNDLPETTCPNDQPERPASTISERCNIDRIETLVEPGYTAHLATCDAADLRSMKAETGQVENAVSYYRRLAQGRIEILEAEQQRRATGGSVGDLIARLPEILGSESPRPAAAHSRFSEPDVEVAELAWPDGRQKLVTDDASLATLPVLSDGELDSVMRRLRDFERELSDYRHKLHGVIDAIENVVATRAVADA